MASVKKIRPEIHPETEFVDEDAHELGGTLGMTAGGVAAGIAGGVGATLLGGSLGGIAAGPIGAVTGAAIGGALGGKAGEAVARKINPTEEERYWSEHYTTRPYVSAEEDFETYRPAYRYGVESYTNFPGAAFNRIEPELADGWEKARGDSSLSWEKAREATRDAYSRVHGLHSDSVTPEVKK